MRGEFVKLKKRCAGGKKRIRGAANWVPFGCQVPAVDEIDVVLDVTKRLLRNAFLVEPSADHHSLLPLPRHVEMFSSRDPGKSPARVCQIGTAKSGVLEPPCNHFAARATLREA